MFYKIILVVLFILIAIALCFLLAAFLKLPTARNLKNVTCLTKQSFAGQTAIARFTDKIADTIARKIKISDMKKDIIEGQLEALEMDITPEKYIANAISKGLIVGIFSIFIFLIHWVFNGFFSFIIAAIGVLGIIMAVIVTKGEYNRLNEIFNEKKKNRC